jgi:hypothetical protein
MAWHPFSLGNYWPHCRHCYKSVIICTPFVTFSLMPPFSWIRCSNTLYFAPIWNVINFQAKKSDPRVGRRSGAVSSMLKAIGSISAGVGIKENEGPLDCHGPAAIGPKESRVNMNVWTVSSWQLPRFHCLGTRSLLWNNNPKKRANEQTSIVYSTEFVTRHNELWFPVSWILMLQSLTECQILLGWCHMLILWSIVVGNSGLEVYIASRRGKRDGFLF